MYKPCTYLALGDSYTIGEAVALCESFPYQTVQHLRTKGFAVAAPEIVATTGWTTEDLEAALLQRHFLKSYDLVSLLIGVNNQYRGWPLQAYKAGFENLLQKAIAVADGDVRRVFVLSIPDYGVTPFAKDRNPQKIAAEIEAFNKAASDICDKQKVLFIDITSGFKAAAFDETLIAADGLHPSAKAYHQWAIKLTDAVVKTFK